MQAGRADLVVAPPPSFSPELPGPRSGLGATELRISDLLDGGRGAKHALINRVVYRDWSNTRTAFDYSDLLEALGFAPRSVVARNGSGAADRQPGESAPSA
jgi:hypothetical protein